MSKTGSLLHPVQIGGLTLPGNLFLAPVAGYSDYAFRSICAEFGASFAFTEMVSAEALVRNSGKTKTLMARARSEKAYAVQLFGADPATVGQAARIVLETTDTDCLDINAGCPVPKIVKTGAGAALTRDPDRLFFVVQAAVNAVQKAAEETARKQVPVTVKIRAGWDASAITWKEAAEAAIALWEKGIEPDADITAALLNMLLLNGQQHGAGVDDDDGSRERSGTGSEDTSAAPFDGLYNCRLLSLAREPGLLTLFNHISGGTRHWIILPFTFPSGTEEIVGNIRVLLNREKKNTEKVVLSAESSVFKYSFVLYYNKNRILSGAFSIVPEPLPSVVQQITVTLQNLCDGGTVIFNPYGSYSLWDANPEDITAVDTEV